MECKHCLQALPGLCSVLVLVLCLSDEGSCICKNCSHGLFLRQEVLDLWWGQHHDVEGRDRRQEKGSGLFMAKNSEATWCYFPMGEVFVSTVIAGEDWSPCGPIALSLAIPSKTFWHPGCLFTSLRPLPALTCSHLLQQGLEMQLKSWLDITTWRPALQSHQNSDHHRRKNSSVWEPCTSLSRKTCCLWVPGWRGWKLQGVKYWEEPMWALPARISVTNFSLWHEIICWHVAVLLCQG